MQYQVSRGLIFWYMLLGIVKRVWRMMLLPWGGFMELPFGLILFGNNSIIEHCSFSCHQLLLQLLEYTCLFLRPLSLYSLHLFYRNLPPLFKQNCSFLYLSKSNSIRVPLISRYVSRRLFNSFRQLSSTS